ncbi:MAG: hypothetical protein K1X88_24305 [Nannocystaceae bacterium]|nr:hypothetical protein [Nannocystaceae bacterium]
MLGRGLVLALALAACRSTAAPSAQPHSPESARELTAPAVRAAQPEAAPHKPVAPPWSWREAADGAGLVRGSGFAEASARLPEGATVEAAQPVGTSGWTVATMMAEVGECEGSQTQDWGLVLRRKGDRRVHVLMLGGFDTDCAGEAHGIESLALELRDVIAGGAPEILVRGSLVASDYGECDDACACPPAIGSAQVLWICGVRDDGPACWAAIETEHDQGPRAPDECTAPPRARAQWRRTVGLGDGRVTVDGAALALDRVPCEGSAPDPRFGCDGSKPP